MTIEKVLLKRHLKAGDREYPVGIYPNRFFEAIPEDILGEVHRGEVVDILEESRPSPPPVEEKEISSKWRKTEEAPAKKEPEKVTTVRRARRVVK